MASDNYVYVIGRESGPVKVGISSGPHGRLMQLQIGCPFELKLLHQRRCLDRNHAVHHERNFHELYEDKRLNGEWFDLEADLAIEGIDTAFEYESYDYSNDIIREFVKSDPDGPRAPGKILKALVSTGMPADRAFDLLAILVEAVRDERQRRGLEP